MYIYVFYTYIYITHIYITCNNKLSYRKVLNKIFKHIFSLIPSLLDFCRATQIQKTAFIPVIIIQFCSLPNNTFNLARSSTKEHKHNKAQTAWGQGCSWRASIHLWSLEVMKHKGPKKFTLVNKTIRINIQLFRAMINANKTNDRKMWSDKVWIGHWILLNIYSGVGILCKT